MPELLTTLLGVMFVAGTLLHSAQKAGKKVTAHDDCNNVDGETARVQNPLPRCDSPGTSKSQYPLPLSD